MKILFFDGYCSLCNGFIDWGMRRDRNQVVHYASLQGKTATQKLPQSYLSTLETVVYFRDGQIFEKSDAVLLFLKDLGGWISIWSALLVIPKPIRNFFYTKVAQNRYRILKKRNTCRIPDESEKKRLLD